MVRRRLADLGAPPVLAALARRGWYVGVAESLTGGSLASACAEVPGASQTFRGGVVAYASEVKADVLGVDAELLDSRGAVHPEVARQMAQGVARLLNTQVGLSTTGVAGPTPQDGEPVGTVYVACAFPGGTWVRGYRLGGNRRAIRKAAVALSLALARAAIDSSNGASGRCRAPR